MTTTVCDQTNVVDLPVFIHTKCIALDNDEKSNVSFDTA